VTAQLCAAQSWVDAVWGTREGYFSWALGVSGHFNGSGKYEFDKWLQRDGGRWPDDRDRFLDEAIEKSAESDVYVAPYLRSSPSRKRGTALPSFRLYGDLDYVPAGQLATSAGVLVLGPGGLLVSSGRVRHVYPLLPEELEPCELERLNQHLAYALGADAGWSETKVLRLPGTWNHKGRARGTRSWPVELLDFRPAVKLSPPPASARGSERRATRGVPSKARGCGDALVARDRGGANLGRTCFVGVGEGVRP
jgi:hypothetical protein